MKALEIKNLKKTYANGVEALKEVSFEVGEGDFFGLLGPNGAGKTTIIGIITDLVNKTSGAASIFGKNIDTDFNGAKRFLGVVPQEMNFSIFEKVEDIVVNQAGYYGIPRSIAKNNAEKYLKQLGLWEKRDHKSLTLSGGMKRRLMIARALVHEPKLLVLDEPTAGVDVELRRGMWEFLTKINKEGITIILTTHYLEEAENLCNKIAIIDKGKIVENADKKELLRRLDKEIFIFDLKSSIKEVKSIKNLTINKIDDYTLEVELSKEHNMNALFDYFGKSGIEIKSMRNKTNRLEKLFLDIVDSKK
jgi:ABC-2 type transport system ATP-binding protein